MGIHFVRDHEPLTMEEFNGYFNRGDQESVPPDHFAEAINIRYTESSFDTRYGIDLYNSPVDIAPDNVLRVHPYTMQNQQSLLVLTTGGHIHHIVSNVLIYTDILVKANMTDFNVVSWAGRAYITPFFTDSDGYEKGLQNEFLYVYMGTGVAARKAAGPRPTGSALVATASGAGFSDIGFHIFAVVYESDTGFLSGPGPAVFGSATSVSNTLGFDISNIPVPADAFYVKKHIVATIKIQNYNGDQDGYQFFFVPGGDMLPSVTAKHVDFFDIDLLDDASHLIDNFSEIPAGVGLNTYHGRLVLTTTYTDISVAYASASGEPEAIDQVDGVMIVPLDGKPLTNCQEYRDILYLFKNTRTVGYSDNRDVPATWQSVTVDEGVGAPVHGVSTVLDSGGVNVEYLLIGDYSGIILFDGSYTEPELSYKIRNFWFGLERTQFRKIELVNDSISKIIYCVLPDGTLLMGDYNNGKNAKDIRWVHKWSYDVPITSIELINTSTLVIGASANGVNQSGLYKMVIGKTNDTLYDTSNNLSIVKIPNPTIKTAYTAVSEGENIMHFTAIRLRVTGTGNLLPTLFSLDDIITQTLIAIPITPTSSKHLTRLCNMQTDKIAIELKTTVINEVFHVNRIILFAKEVFAEYPSVS